MGRTGEKSERRIIARNKKARYRYSVEDRLEAGLVLRGTEVKSLRAGRAAMADAFARFRGNELWLVNLHIAPCDHAGAENHEPMRPRKLLLKRRELTRVKKKLEERGYTLVPLTLYFTRGLAKVELGLCRGKRMHDRREDLKRRDAEREMRKHLKR